MCENRGAQTLGGNTDPSRHRQPRSTGYPAQGTGRGGWKTWACCWDGLVTGDVEAYLCPELWDGASGLSVSPSVPGSQAAASDRLSRELHPLGKGLWTGPLLRSVHQCSTRPARPQPPAQPCFQEYPPGGSGHSRFQLTPIFREGQDWSGDPHRAVSHRPWPHPRTNITLKYPDMAMAQGHKAGFALLQLCRAASPGR